MPKGVAVPDALAFDICREVENRAAGAGRPLSSCDPHDAERGALEFFKPPLNVFVKVVTFDVSQPLMS